MIYNNGLAIPLLQSLDQPQMQRWFLDFSWMGVTILKLWAFARVVKASNSRQIKLSRVVKLRRSFVPLIHHLSAACVKGDANILFSEY